MIDTLAIAENLAAAGIEQEQAKAHAQTIANAVGQQRGEIATNDFVRSEISGVRAEISPVRSDVAALKWITGVNLAITLALFAAFLAR